MVRPCFLVIDREYPGSISSRKLVIETAKFNVITAYRPDEAVETLARFPNVDGVVLNADTESSPCEVLIERLRAVRPDVRIVVTSAGGHSPHCGPEEFHVDSLDPKELLQVLQEMCPVATDMVQQRDRYLTSRA